MTQDWDVIHVESFELSSRNEHAIKTVGRLQRQFPGPSLALSSSLVLGITVAPTQKW